MKHIIIALTMAAFVAAANAGEGCCPSKGKTEPSKDQAACQDKAKTECPAKGDADKSEDKKEKAE